MAFAGEQDGLWRSKLTENTTPNERFLRPFGF